MKITKPHERATSDFLWGRQNKPNLKIGREGGGGDSTKNFVKIKKKGP